ncbi:MAG: hypothetical protein AB1746_06010 [Candidatus Zixiibacteriota bacterium]
MFSGRNLFLIGFAAVMTMIMAGCGDESPTASYQNHLNGTWSETYKTSFDDVIIPEFDPQMGEVPDPIQIFHPDYGQYIIDLPLRSVLTLSNFRFGLKIFDDQNTLQKELRGDYRKSGKQLIFNVKYTWAAFYEAWNIEYDPYAEYSDTLSFDILNTDSLAFRTVSLSDGDSGMAYIKSNSILWSVPGGLGFKFSGIFIRQD